MKGNMTSKQNKQKKHTNAYATLFYAQRVYLNNNDRYDTGQTYKEYPMSVNSKFTCNKQECIMNKLLLYMHETMLEHRQSSKRNTPTCRGQKGNASCQNITINTPTNKNGRD